MNPTLSVIDAIARHCSTSRACILGRDKHKSIALARKIAMYCAREFIRAPAQPSYPELARTFERGDHTTVISAVRSVSRLKDDPWIADAVRVGRVAADLATAPSVDPFLSEYQARDVGAAAE